MFHAHPAWFHPTRKGMHMELNDIRRLMNPRYPVNDTMMRIAAVLIPMGMPKPPVFPKELLTVSGVPSPFPPNPRPVILNLTRPWPGRKLAKLLKIARWESTYQVQKVRSLSFSCRPVDAIFVESLSPVREHWWELWLPDVQTLGVQLVIWDRTDDLYYDGGFIARGVGLAEVFPDVMPTFIP